MSLPHPLFSTAQQKAGIQSPTGTSFRWKKIFRSRSDLQSLAKKQRKSNINVNGKLPIGFHLGRSGTAQQRGNEDSWRDGKTWDLTGWSPRRLRSQEEMQFHAHKAAWKSAHRVSPWDVSMVTALAPAFLGTHQPVLRGTGHKNVRYEEQRTTLG